MILIVFVHYISYAGFRNKSYFSVKLPLSPLLRRTRLTSVLALPGEVQRGRGFEGGSRISAARLQARPTFPLGRIQYPSKGSRHVLVGGNVQVFTLAVLPSQSAQVPVLAKNVTLEGGMSLTG